MEIISSRRNPLCVHMKRLGADGGYRVRTQEFLCDGIKLLEEAAVSGAAISAVLTSSHLPFPLPVDTRVYFAERGVIDSLSSLKNPQDTLFTCKMPAPCTGIDADGTHILLDSMQDPGNVGAIIRSSNAFGIKTVILIGDCADPYNPKTVRASMGAIFRQKIVRMDISILKELVDGGMTLLGAALGEDCMDITGALLQNAIVAIGSEGRGLSSQVLDLCAGKITIRIAPECESLNAAAAAAIIMWEATRCHR